MEHGIRRWPSSKQHLKLRKRKKEPEGEAEEKVLDRQKENQKHKDIEIKEGEWASMPKSIVKLKKKKQQGFFE